MFIGRRPDGTIYGSWTVRQKDDEFHPGLEEVEDNDPELLEFLIPKPVIIDPIDELRSALKVDPTLLDKLIAVR